MKKIIMFIVSAFTVIGLSGCSSDRDDLTTLFLVDENGYSYGGVPYICESMRDWSRTAPNGEFTFYQREECLFDFYGYYGTDPDDTTIPYNEYIYIVDDLDRGKNNIPYECELFNAGGINYTYDDGLWDGSFDYDQDDRCVFYL